MKKIGVVYGSSSGNTKEAAVKIQQKIDGAELIAVDSISVEDMKDYDVLLLGSSTWGYGDLQDDWEGKVGTLESSDLSGKKVGFFGTGDQASYPDTFVDALGILYDAAEKAGAGFVGAWPTDGYEYDASRAEKDGAFVGLALDEDNQGNKSDERISAWVDLIKTELE